jgi:hypothetical protein
MPCVLGPQGANHPDWNSEPNVPWSESELGKQWLAAGKKQLPWGKSKTNANWVNSTEAPAAVHSTQEKKRAASSSRGGDRPANNTDNKKLIDDSTYLCITTTHKPLQDYLLTCTISTPRNITKRELSCLVNTDALDANYVLRDVGEWIIKNGGNTKKCSVSKICSCNSDMCIPCLGIVYFDFSFLNELTKKQETISLEARMIDNDFDIILGRKDAPQ